MRAIILIGIATTLSVGGLSAQDDGKLQSGIKVGDVLPGPFDVVVVNGKVAKDRQHCLVTEFGLLPVVMVFAREPDGGKDGALMALLAKLDEAVSRHRDTHGLASCVIFLSPDARNSANNSAEEDPNKLVDEALKREALAKRLEQRAEKLKNVVVAYMGSEGPKEFRLNPGAEVTVLFYNNHKVLANLAFAPGRMTAEDGDRISAIVNEALAKKTP